jgi:glycosyltransferase involved in cell wall biosynthesis
MFRFKFVLDYFQKEGSRGPTIEANIRAKWLSIFCPSDLEIAFAPYPGQRPIYKPEMVKLLRQDEPGWWNHYFFNSHLINQEKGRLWSLGPNIDVSRPVSYHSLTVAYSTYHKQKILEQWKLPQDQVMVIPNMVDFELFYPRKKHSQFTVGWIGYDHPSRMTKGVEVIPYLARAFPEIKFEMIHARKPQFVEEWLPETLPNLKVYHNIPHYRMGRMIAQWHVLICGSKWETFGSHILEAMACGVPVIAAAVGAIPEVASSQILLEDMKWGQPQAVKHPYDWTEESLERFAEALRRVYLDKGLYNTLVQQAIKESRRYTPKAVADQWFKFMYQCRELSLKS